MVERKRAYPGLMLSSSVGFVLDQHGRAAERETGDVLELLQELADAALRDQAVEPGHLLDDALGRVLVASAAGHGGDGGEVGEGVGPGAVAAALEPMQV